MSRVTGGSLAYPKTVSTSASVGCRRVRRRVWITFGAIDDCCLTFMPISARGRGGAFRRGPGVSRHRISPRGHERVEVSERGSHQGHEDIVVILSVQFSCMILDAF